MVLVCLRQGSMFCRVGRGGTGLCGRGRGVCVVYGGSRVVCLPWWGCHCCLPVPYSVVPTKRRGELRLIGGVQHRPADGEYRSNTGETTQ